MSDDDIRAQVVAEALSWECTPYHHMGRIKGAGADCAMFPLEVYTAAAVIPPVEKVGFYPLQWNLHRDAERYLDMVRTIVAQVGGREVDAPTGPADFVMWRWGRTFAHGAIILDWPRIIHSVGPDGTGPGVIQDDARRNARLAAPDRPRLFFTLWG